MRDTSRNIFGMIWIVVGVIFLALAILAAVTAWHATHDASGIFAAAEMWTRLLLALTSFAFAVIARRVTSERQVTPTSHSAH